MDICYSIRPLLPIQLKNASGKHRNYYFVYHIGDEKTRWKNEINTIAK